MELYEAINFFACWKNPLSSLTTVCMPSSLSNGMSDTISTAYNAHDGTLECSVGLY